VLDAPGPHHWPGLYLVRVSLTGGRDWQQRSHAVCQLIEMASNEVYDNWTRYLGSSITGLLEEIGA
jgi:hypothetical protein